VLRDGVEAATEAGPLSAVPLAVVPAEGQAQTAVVAKGQPPELRAGVGFAIYERRRDGGGGEIEEFITVVAAAEPTLHAVSADQFNAWKGKRLIAKPVRLEPR
jgi:hypothetical protein